MAIDPAQWKDLPYVIAVILLVLGMAWILYKALKEVIGFLRSRDADYLVNTKKMVDDQNEFWRMFSEKQAINWQGFIGDMVDKVCASNGSVAEELKDVSGTVLRIEGKIDAYYDRRKN
jgi:hypothetical protein